MRSLVLILTVTLLGGVARAEDKPTTTPPARPDKPVRVGPTTVTVIDEQESVDDIISRVRKARKERTNVAPPPAVVPPAPLSPPGDGKAKVREAKDDERAARKQARERRQRLRETARERRANRLRGARAE
jgi:hypothetical protein